MFLDGNIYATVARNFAFGIGSMGKPFFTETSYSHFFEHPPMAMWLQSIFYEIFGDYLLIDRLYSVLTTIISGYLIVKIWKSITKSYTLSWLPLLFFISIETVFWSANQNVLENTMMVFLLLTFFGFLKWKQNNRFLWLLFAGFTFCLAILSKGVFALFIMGVPFFWWLASKKMEGFWKMTMETISIIIFGALFLVSLSLLIPGLDETLLNYFNKQIVKNGAVKELAEDSRFRILKVFLNNLLVPIVLAVILYFSTRKSEKSEKGYSTEALAFAIISVSGVLPIIAGPVHSSFYILAVYPFMALALALWNYPRLITYFSDKNPLSTKWKIVKWVNYGLLTIAFSVMVIQYGKPSRNAEIISDCHQISAYIGENKTLGIIDTKIEDRWDMETYMYRLHYNSIKLVNNTDLKYIITDKKQAKDVIKGYQKIDLKLDKYILYELK
jgi:4-amino-4-deoxy-L-arabinose transferase-like glycosyltransferase